MYSMQEKANENKKYQWVFCNWYIYMLYESSHERTVIGSRKKTSWPRSDWE